MTIDDFVGENLSKVLDTIEKQYQAMEYEIIYTQSPKLSKEADILQGTERVVRQKLIDDKKIQLVVAVFKEQPDLF